MAWEADKMSRTLIIKKITVGPKKFRYIVYPMTRVITPDGTSYIEPRPMHRGMGDVAYDFVEFMGEQPIDSDIQLNADNNMTVRTAQFPSLL